MIVNEKEAVARLSSPLNLMNRLAAARGGNGNSRQNAMAIFGIGKKKETEKIEKLEKIEKIEKIEEPVSPSSEQILENQDVTVEQIIENSETQIQLTHAHDTALRLLNNSVKQLSEKLDDVKAERLPGVIMAASKVVESIRKERSEAIKSQKDREVHYHFYTPQQKKISDYGIIDVSNSPEEMKSNA